MQRVYRQNTISKTKESRKGRENKIKIRVESE